MICVRLFLLVKILLFRHAFLCVARPHWVLQPVVVHSLLSMSFGTKELEPKFAIYQTCPSGGRGFTLPSHLLFYELQREQFENLPYQILSNGLLEAPFYGTTLASFRQCIHWQLPLDRFVHVLTGLAHPLVHYLTGL